MDIVYKILVVLGVLTSLFLTALVFFTGKGDAMGGGGAIRTTFKGSATIEDKISRLTLIVAGLFMALMLAIDAVSNRIPS